MTVATTGYKKQYTGNGVTTEFDFPYKFIADTDLVVVVTDTDTGLSTEQTLTSHYTVSGAGESAGGTVTFLSAPDAYTRVTIYREDVIDQPAALTNQSAYFLDNIESAFDKQVLIIQQQQEQIDRCFKVPVTSASNPSSVEDYLTDCEAAQTAAEAAAAEALVYASRMTRQVYTETIVTSTDTITMDFLATNIYAIVDGVFQMDGSFTRPTNNQVTFSAALATGSDVMIIGDLIEPYTASASSTFSTMYVMSQETISFASLISAIGSGNATIIIDTEVVIQENVTVGTGIYLVRVGGGFFNTDIGYTLTINGQLSAGPRTLLFAGSGLVVLNYSSVECTRPEWWYSGSGTWTTAIQAAVDHAHGDGLCGHVKLSNGEYDITGGTIYIQTDSTQAYNRGLYAPLTFEGVGMSRPNGAVYNCFEGATTLKKADAGKMIKINIESDNTPVLDAICNVINIRHMNFVGNTDSEVDITGIWGYKARVRMEHLYFTDMAVGINFQFLPTGATATFTDFSNFEDISMNMISKHGLKVEQPDGTSFRRIHMYNFTDNASTGIYIRHGQGWSVQDCLINFLDNAIEGTHVAAIYVESSTSCKISTCHFEEINGCAIYAVAPKGLAIENNRFFNTADIDLTSATISVDVVGGAEPYGGNTVTGNVFRHNRSSGFDIRVSSANSFSGFNIHEDVDHVPRAYTSGTRIVKEYSWGSGMRNMHCFRVRYVEHSISTLTEDSDIATGTCAAAHGITAGDVGETIYGRIAGASPSGYNGNKSITITGEDTFTYAVTGPLADATGTLTLSLWMVSEIQGTDMTFKLQPWWITDTLRFYLMDRIRNPNAVMLTKFTGAYIPCIDPDDLVYPSVQFEDSAGTLITTEDTNMDFLIMAM